MTRRRRLRLVAWAILVAGLAASAWVFHQADEDDASDVIGVVIIDGQSYPVTTRDSKLYRHDLERFGGKMAVFADDVNRWLASLLHGRRLAIVIAVAAAGAAFGCFCASGRKDS